MGKKAGWTKVGNTYHHDGGKGQVRVVHRWSQKDVYVPVINGAELKWQMTRKAAMAIVEERRI